MREASPEAACVKVLAERPAATLLPVTPLIARRWSSRAIDADRPVPRTAVLTLLEAARWAPSSRNEQPWRYLVFDDDRPQELQAARGCLKPGNAWARNAPVLLLSMAKLAFSDPDRPGANRDALHDLGAASMAMALQAVQQGLVFHLIGGYDRALARNVFGIPDAFALGPLVAIGQPGRLSKLDDVSLARERRKRERRPIESTAFHGRFGAPFDASGDVAPA